jgi:hypothetical protein
MSEVMMFGKVPVRKIKFVNVEPGLNSCDIMWQDDYVGREEKFTIVGSEEVCSTLKMLRALGLYDVGEE